MFENDNQSIEQDQQLDVSSEASSEPQSNTQQASQNEETTQAKEVPFHEHPRWKEVMEERNQERQARQALEQRLADMQRQFQESMQPKAETKDPMYERLKGIDPEFADYLRDVKSQAQLAKQLQDELNGIRQEQFVNSALNKISELNKANNVSPELAALYQDKIDLAYRTGQIKNLTDLEAAYKAIHEPMAKMFEARERAALEKYTASKKQDAAKPTPQAKAKAQPSQPKPQMPTDPMEAKKLRIQAMASALRNGRS